MYYGQEAYIILKLKKAVILISSLFLCGSLCAFIGFAKGNDIASVLSRPIGANFWTTSGDFMTACTYVPAIFGISLIILAIVFSTITFTRWINQKNNEL